MTIQLAKFGDLLISRPAGREAYDVARAYLLSEKPEHIEVDFTGVKVLAPSWIDEFLTRLKQEYGKENISLLPSDNPSVRASLKWV